MVFRREFIGVGNKWLKNSNFKDFFGKINYGVCCIGCKISFVLSFEIGIDG